MPSATLIIGIGSPFGADRLGWEAVERLQRGGIRRRFPAVDLLTLDRPGPVLLAKMEGRERVILIDAMHGGFPPGTVRRLRVERLMAQTQRFSSHDFGVAETLALGDALGRLPGEVILIGIEASGGEVGQEKWSSALLLEVEEALKAS